MLNEIHAVIDTALGLGLCQLTLGQMTLRAIIVYILAVILVRISKRRFLAKPSTFDLVLLLILGSVISRAVTGNVPFFSTLAVACVLVAVHYIFSYLTFYSASIGSLIKGYPIELIRDGQIRWENMRLSGITQRDLLSALRRNAQISDPAQVHSAILERNGEISVIPKPHIVSVAAIKVEDGVQKIMLELKRS